MQAPSFIRRFASSLPAAGPGVLLVLVALRALHVLATPAHAQSRPAAARTAPVAQHPRARDVDAFVARIMKERRIPGVQLAVVQRGRVVMEGAYGVANVEHGVPVRRETVFPIASATKSFTGIAVMQLVQRGQLDLSAPIARYVDSLPESWRSITIRQLLSHGSGLPDIVDPETGALITPDWDAAWARVQTLPLGEKPGTRFSYNQTNYLLVGRAIERITGRPFRALLEDGQFRVVGMRGASIGDSRDVIAGEATTYSYFRITAGKPVASDTLRRVYTEFPPPLRTAAGIVTSAGEVARWLIAVQKGTLVDTTHVRTMWTPTTLADGSSSGYGLGWPIIERPAHRAVAGIGGGKAAFFLYPDDDLAVVILTNLQGGSPHVFIDQVADFFVPGIAKPSK